MGIRDRADFIENIQEAHTHLLILTNDIKYQIDPKLQRYIEAAEQAVGYIIRKMMEEDIKAVLEAVGKEQKAEGSEI